MLLFKKFQDLTVTKTLRRPNLKLTVPVLGNSKVGATAGWVITGGTNIAHATLPASQTSSTLIINLSGHLEPGDTLKSLWLNGQAESAGANVAMTLSLRRVRSAAADNEDTELGTKSTGNFTADTLFTFNNTGISLEGASGSNGALVQEDSVYYLRITGTTAASTDIDLLSVTMVVDKS